MSVKWTDPGSGVEFHICTVCFGPCETVNHLPGGANFVCRHRDFWGGTGHRRHAVCCAERMRGVS